MKDNSTPLVLDGSSLESLIQILTEVLLELQQCRPENQKFYDNADLKRLLNLSDSSLHRIRKSNTFPYKRIGRKIYYPASFFTQFFK